MKSSQIRSRSRANLTKYMLIAEYNSALSELRKQHSEEEFITAINRLEMSYVNLPHDMLSKSQKRSADLLRRVPYEDDSEANESEKTSPQKLETASV